MVPQKCIEDIFRIIDEQDSQRILFISDDKDNSKALYEALYEKYKERMSLYAGEMITDFWDMMIISDFYIIKDVALKETLKGLLPYVKHSLLITSGTYLKEDGTVDGIAGLRHLHPVRFCEFDFTYQTYEAEYSWSLYNFYNNDFGILDREDDEADAKMERKKLNVLYVIPHNNLTGGVKCLLTHAKHLFRRGHNVYLMQSGSSTAIPSWSDIVEGEDITGQVTEIDAGEVSRDILYRKKIDVIVVGWYEQIRSFVGLKLPILYWEQGYEMLFGDTNHVMSYNHSRREVLRYNYQLPITIASNSKLIETIVKARFGRDTRLLYTGIDTERYYPLSEKQMLVGEIPKILLVGNPRLPFKNFECLLTALSFIWKRGYRFHVTWACQIEPVTVTPFEIEYKVQVPQLELAELYRTHDIYINTSVYEAFSMPPLEAMASGTAVIATDCGGINTYAIPGENAILTEQGNISDLITAIIYLIENPFVRNILAENGRKTALEFRVEKTIDQLEDVLYYTIKEHYSRVEKSSENNQMTK